MTQTRYMEPIDSFKLNIQPEPWYEVDVVELGKVALESANKELGNCICFDFQNIFVIVLPFKILLLFRLGI